MKNFLILCVASICCAGYVWTLAEDPALSVHKFLNFGKAAAVIVALCLLYKSLLNTNKSK